MDDTFHVFILLFKGRLFLAQIQFRQKVLSLISLCRLYMLICDDTLSTCIISCFPRAKLVSNICLSPLQPSKPEEIPLPPGPESIPLPGECPSQPEFPAPDESEDSGDEAQDRNARGVYGTWARVQKQYVDGFGHQGCDLTSFKLIFMLPQKIWGEHIVAASYVRPSVHAQFLSGLFLSN